MVPICYTRWTCTERSQNKGYDTFWLRNAGKSSYKGNINNVISNENAIGLAAFHRNFQYENSLTCYHQFACAFFWDIAIPDWMICDQPLWTTVLARRFGHVNQWHEAVTDDKEKSVARLRLPKSAQSSLIGTAYSRTAGRTDGRHSETFRLKILGRDIGADPASRRICCLQSLDHIWSIWQ